MLQNLKDRLAAFLLTPFGHALEHAVTAAAATAGGLLLAAYFTNGHTLHADDLGVAWTSFTSGLLFGIRTAFREYFKSPSDPTKRKPAKKK